MMGRRVPPAREAYFQKAGHRILLVVGGATGMVVIPVGQADERKLLTPEQVAQNSEGLKNHLLCFAVFCL